MTKIDGRSNRDPLTNQKESETKNKISRKIILTAAETFDIEQSDKQLAIPTHRKRRFITMEEYQKAVQQGKKISELDKECLKGLIIFYNTMLKGKIQLPKEKFIELYEQGLTLDEIAKQYNIRKDQMCFLREYYGIKRKGAKYQKRLANEQPLSQEAKDVIIGSMLGDGHITKWGYFSEKHSPAQLEYLKWKASFFKQITTDKSWDYYEAIDKRSGSLIKTHCYRTTTHSFLYEMRNKFYKEVNGKWTKVIPNDIADMINERVLAIWFMDDGSTDWMYRNGIKEYGNAKPMAKICTDSFSVSEVTTLITILNLKFGIKSYIGNERNRIIFDTINTPKLLDILRPYATSDLMYKFDERMYSDKMKKSNKS